MKNLLWLSLAFLFFACGPKESVTVRVTNPAGFERKQETVSVPVFTLKDLVTTNDPEALVVKDAKGRVLLSQWVDNDGDGLVDELLFQVWLAPGESQSFEVTADTQAVKPNPDAVAYSRFVPERTDDYTWENDRVAFRTFGPEAMRMAKAGEPGGTLTSGIDLWLKRVPYSIIDKWYAGYQQDPMYYHRDIGEGYDPYHVGKSRGTGGVGIWLDDTLVASENFVTHRTLANGPIRTLFELDYEPWSNHQVKETKRISLDLGSHFAKFESSFEGSGQPVFAVGITLHQGGGETNWNLEEGWFRHWEVIDSAGLGEGIVMDPAVVDSVFAHRSATPDQSQLLVLTNATDRLVYYAGYGWVPSGHVASTEDWDEMLRAQALRLASPLQVSLE